MESIDDVLQKLKDGEVVTLCDIYSAVSLEGKKGGEMRLAALLAWVTNAAGSDSADALLLEIKNMITNLTVEGRFRVENLGRPTMARQLAAGASSTNTALGTATNRISIRAVGAAIRYNLAVGGSATADPNTSHYIADGERLDLLILDNTNIAVIRDVSTDGVLELTELV